MNLKKIIPSYDTSFYPNALLQTHLRIDDYLNECTNWSEFVHYFCAGLRRAISDLNLVCKKLANNELRIQYQLKFFDGLMSLNRYWHDDIAASYFKPGSRIEVRFQFIQEYNANFVPLDSLDNYFFPIATKIPKASKDDYSVLDVSDDIYIECSPHTELGKGAFGRVREVNVNGETKVMKKFALYSCEEGNWLESRGVYLEMIRHQRYFPKTAPEFGFMYDRESNRVPEFNEYSLSGGFRDTAARSALVFDKIEGIELFYLIFPKDKKAKVDLDILDRVEIFEQILDQVNDAHQKGGIHTDLKLENIMVSITNKNKWVVRVIDGGSALSENELKNILFHQEGISTTHIPFEIASENRVPRQELGPGIDSWCLGNIILDLFYPIITEARRASGYSGSNLSFTKEHCDPRIDQSELIEWYADVLRSIDALTNRDRTAHLYYRQSVYLTLGSLLKHTLCLPNSDTVNEFKESFSSPIPQEDRMEVSKILAITRTLKKNLNTRQRGERSLSNHASSSKKSRSKEDSQACTLQ